MTTKILSTINQLVVNTSAYGALACDLEVDCGTFGNPTRLKFSNLITNQPNNLYETLKRMDGVRYVRLTIVSNPKEVANNVGFQPTETKTKRSAEMVSKKGNGNLRGIQG